MRIQLFESICELNETEWNAVADRDFPFLNYHFLRALETTNCLGHRTGWLPLYFTVWERDELSGAVVAFIKNNSYGEYIFDFAWAQASHSFGIPYYPKLVIAVPFTPATGSKILVRSELSTRDKTDVRSALLLAIKETAAQLKMSSVHALFLPVEEQEAFARAGFFVRHSFQYHWENQAYESFEGFLAKLKGKRRREIQRERSQVRESEVKISRLTGESLTLNHAKIFYQFYSDTVDKRGGNEYLTADFFDQVFKTMKNNLLFVLAEDSECRPVAGALFYFGNKTLYGRHWGCLEDHRALHFELCYYQGIEFAIENNLILFEAGAQGEHKFNRGFLARPTLSAHTIDSPTTGEMIQDFVEREKLEITKVLSNYAERSPFQPPGT